MLVSLPEMHQLVFIQHPAHLPLDPGDFSDPLLVPSPLESLLLHLWAPLSSGAFFVVVIAPITTY